MSSTSLAAARRRRVALARTSLVVAALALAPPRAAAQAGGVTVLGYVTDTAAAPVPAAEVVVEGTARVERTDERGAFRVDGLGPGRLVVTVRRLGFRSRSDRFQTRAGDTLQLLLDLVPLPAALAGVTVTGRRDVRPPRLLDEFEARRERGGGAFLTRADIVKRAPMHTSDLFRSMAGVTVVPSRGASEPRMMRSRDCTPDLYVDGLEARGVRIDDIPPADIAGIEVFRGPAETPPRFRHERAVCGVVSIWTRGAGRS